MGDVRPLLLGIEGLKLAEAEKAFLKEAPPAGFLLFARNIESLEQTRDLCVELSEYSRFIAVDQEGGRVQRVKFGGKLPPASIFGEWFAEDTEKAKEAATLSGFLLAAQLRDVGANWLLGPLLDVAHDNTHQIIGNRSFSSDPHVVVELASAYAEGVKKGGCLRCLKHAPGHGRAVVDSHFELPVVEAGLEQLEADMLPFKALAPKEDFIMTAHIRYPALDAGKPATYSGKTLQMMRNDWNFNGLILADDVGMKALEGDYVGRVRTSLEAGCDIVITAFSVLKHGMAGTVFDVENFRNVAAAGGLRLGGRAAAYLEKIEVPVAADGSEVGAARRRLRELWDDGPARLGYSLEL